VRLLAEKYKYVTRFFGRISPEEMTVDPTFVPAPELPDVSNVHDLTGVDPELFWGCKDTQTRRSCQRIGNKYDRGETLG